MKGNCTLEAITFMLNPERRQETQLKTASSAHSSLLQKNLKKILDGLCLYGYLPPLAYGCFRTPYSPVAQPAERVAVNH